MSERALPMPRPVPDYNEAIVKKFIIATVFWAIVAFLVGVYIATELAWPQFNLGLSFINFGRLRPVHTSAAIFAFGGSALLGTSFYVVQRTCRARLFGGEALANFVFWGYQFFIVMAALSYVIGFSQSQEYAEPEWHLDVWLTIIWVAYAVIFVGTLMKREEPHIYVANWFYLAFILTIAVLHVGNNLAIPISLYSAKSYSVASGVQNAMIQWWYGHNAVGFFLTAGFLGMMYYFIPKAANRPIYSYRLSVVHFWSLIFMYIWAGPHHLHWTALPDWTQTLGMAFSIMLWMPSWGGMINGLMTLSGAWDKLRTDPGLRFSVTAVGFYGMATFEGPVMSIRDVNALSHYTDWGIGHVHSGALGWVAFISFGAIYYLVPVLWKRSGLYSTRLASWHYWIATLGIVFYITSMWVAGIMQGLMWRAYDQFGFLQYSFAESVVAVYPVLCDPAARRPDVPHRRADHGLQPDTDGEQSDHRSGSGASSTRDRAWPGRRRGWGVIAMFARHEFIEKNAFLLLVLTLITIAIGGIVEVVPLFTIETTVEHVKGVRPYSPLEQRGRDIYTREGCYTCHSQQIRALRDEVERYGHFSLAAESMYDHPFQWGSKRIGPDLARVGGKYSSDWHYAHLINPQSVVPGSLMPHYAFLADTPLVTDDIAARLRTLRMVGVPYTDDEIANAAADLATQTNPAADNAALLKRYPKAMTVLGNGREVTEMDALVAYLQVLGTMVDFADPANEHLQQ